MMMRKFLTLAAVAVLAALPAAADTFTVDKGHSDTSFRIRHLVSNVTGRFDDFSGTIDLDKSNMEKSAVQFEIQTASINTGVADRDKHLRSADFFDVEKYPTITFKSTSIKKTGENSYDVTGDFTMHGVTKKITLPVTFLGETKGPRGGTVAGFEASTTLNRKDYGIVWNRALDTGGFILGDDVKVSINLETGKQEPKPAG
jgi:polyisoprenoid-binding protein YceI